MAEEIILKDEKAKEQNIQRSPTLLLAPDIYKIRYTGDPAGEEAASQHSMIRSYRRLICPDCLSSCFREVMLFHIKTLLLIVSLLFFPSFIFAASVPEYNLEVFIDPLDSEINGISRVTVRAGHELLLNSGVLTIHYIKLNNRSVAFDKDSRTARILPDRNGILEISYTGVFKDNSLSHQQNDRVAVNVIDDRGISLTNMWYPDIKGLNRYKLKVTLPEGYEALSEAEGIKKLVKDGRVEFYFHFPHPLDSINLTASNKFIVKKDTYKHIEISAYFFQEDLRLASEYIEFTKEYFKLYENLLGEYPYKRFSIVENFLPTGYSFPTFTLLGGAVVRLPFIVETSLGHEILHQWFGNHVYVDYTKGNWSEGLTTYLADHFYEEQKQKGWEYRKQILIDYKSYVNTENEFPLNDFTGRVDFSSRSIGYGKAAMVFHMLKNLTGEKVFFESLRDVIRKTRFKKASWDDLKKSFETFYKTELSWFFQQWVSQAGIPEIEVTGLQLKQKGSEFQMSFAVVQKKNTYSLKLPLNIYLQNSVIRKSLDIAKERNSFEFLLTDKPDKIVFDEDYDLARDLDIKEFPPVIARLLGDRNIIIALPVGSTENYRSIIERFEKKGAVKQISGEMKDSDMKSSSVVIIGHDNPLIRRLFGKVSFEDAGLSFIVKENPWNPRKVIGIVNGKSQEEREAASGKISHYGKYSRLLFENGRNIEKEIHETQRGLSIELRNDASAVDLSTTKTLSEIIGNVADRKIIYVGEVHDVFAHHAVQLDIITGIFRKNRKIAIGMEMFQRPFQEMLDNFVAGKMSEADFLKKSEYFKRWGFDYLLYKPILDFARAENIPLIALNTEREIVDKVSDEGIDSLSIEEKKGIPYFMDFSDEEYRERLKKIFEMHENSKDKNFDFFYQSQILWDETMSQSIDDFLRDNADYQIVVLAGKGHLEYGSGIPKRTFRRNEQNYAVVLIDAEVDRGIADYVIFPKPVEGVTSPKLMVFISDEGNGLAITGFPDKSVSEKAGMKAGDIILSIDNAAIKSIDDIKIYLLYKKKGDKLKVEVLRKENEQENKMEFEVEL